MEGKTEERHYTPYKYGYSLGNGKEYSENGYLVVYHNGERKEVNSNRVEFYQPYESGKLTKEEFNEIVKGTKGVTDIWGDFASEYYTPSIEELISFIVNEKYCFTKNEKNDVVKLVFESGDIINLIYNFIKSNDCNSDSGYSINTELYLLPYLDKEDIESLGFEYIPDDDVFKRISDHTIHSSFIKFGNESHQLIIDNGESYDTYDCWFNGTIKNISELKVLLNQLNISYG